MKRIKLTPSLDNILRLFAKRLDAFSGESKRSYQKAFSSLQVYLITHFPLSLPLSPSMIEDWVINNLMSGLSFNTVAFYLDKISSLHSGVANSLSSGKSDFYKEIKQKLRSRSQNPGIFSEVRSINAASLKSEEVSPTNKFLWTCLALNAGVPAGKIKALVGVAPEKLEFLDICQPSPLSDGERLKIEETVRLSLKGEMPQWFAMRLRPKVKFSDILARVPQFSGELAIPEFFYPYEEIARRVGRKLVWKGRPVIRDVVFFKYCKKDIYPLFSKIYDLAWCYRSPGSTPGNYASIPGRAMEDFRNAIGILSPDYEVAPAGELKLKPGDKVVIVQGDYAGRHAEILSSGNPDEAAHKVFRVSLLNCNSRWDIGIDARLLKKE